jgi:hypothetical protein
MPGYFGEDITHGLLDGGAEAADIKLLYHL